MTTSDPSEFRVGTTPAERRAAASAEIRERTGIDEVMIERLVRSFYERAADDPLIGPIFQRHVEDWEAHIARICDFWSSVALMTGRYHGTPMQLHMDLPLTSEAFDRWLELFERTALDVCPEVAVAHFMERARRIAGSLEMGVAARSGQIVPSRQTLSPGGQPISTSSRE